MRLYNLVFIIVDDDDLILIRIEVELLQGKQPAVDECRAPVIDEDEGERQTSHTA